MLLRRAVGADHRRDLDREAMATLAAARMTAIADIADALVSADTAPTLVVDDVLRAAR